MNKSILLFAIAFAFASFACQSAPESEENAESGNSEMETEEDVEKIEISGQTVNYSGDGINMNGYIAFESSHDDKRPGVLVIHEWWGHNDYARSRADMLAELGYVALAVDMYGDGKKADHPESAGQFAGEVMGNMEGAKARFEAAMNTLMSNELVNPEEIGVIGYCFGGSVALTMANSGYDLDAVAAFHSGVALPVMPSENSTKARYLICQGEADPFVPKEQADAFIAAMDAAGLAYTYHAFPGVVHGFTNPGADVNGEKFELPLKYDATADAESWEMLQELLASSFE